jgi:hypothetical protein
MLNDAPQDRIPQEWYGLNPVYSGDASIAFDGCEPVEGKGTFLFVGASDGKIQFECQDPEQSVRLDGILEGGQPSVLLPSGPPCPTAIIIASPEGAFVADYRVYLTGHTMTIGDQRNSTAQFRAIGATFNTAGAEQPAYIVLPLYNMLSPSFVTAPWLQPPEIENHCLRIFPTPAQQ